jgi:hypothetical protein
MWKKRSSSRPPPPPPLPSSSTAASASLLIRRRHCCHHNVEIQPKTRYKQKQNETYYENTNNVSHINIIYDKTATSQQNSD